ncbi:uncharacterized protein METZ01_LOCUS446961 [marine metagenome]|uniref:Uncharacterized protein n=1 Tax=marine metagenome TaxID=408172 RepID=A0A382ZF19_9ZZZZ
MSQFLRRWSIQPLQHSVSSTAIARETSTKGKTGYFGSLYHDNSFIGGRNKNSYKC